MFCGRFLQLNKLLVDDYYYYKYYIIIPTILIFIPLPLYIIMILLHRHMPELI